MTDFIRYGKFDTLEHARNGLKGPDTEKLAGARVALYKVHQKAKDIMRKETEHGQEKKTKKK